MRFWNPRSLTILNGRLLSDTQWTISALEAYRVRWEKWPEVSILPSFCWTVLTMWKGSPPFSDTFKLGGNGPITQLGLFTSTERALSKSCVPSATSTASLPQQILACQQSPLVDLASPVSKNWRTSHPFFPRHFPVAHWNTWTRQPFIYSTRGSFLKNT